MAVKIKDFILAQAKKVGKDSDPELLLAISASALDAFELPDSIMAANNLMDENGAIEFAKSNLQVKDHWVREYSKGLNQAIFEKVKEAGLSVEKIKEMEGADTAGKRLNIAIAGLSEMIADGKKSSNKGASDEYVRQVTELQDQLKAAKAETEQRVTETAAQYRSRMEALALRSNMAFDWNPVFSQELRDSVYQSAIRSEADKMGVVLKFDEETNGFGVFQKADPTLPFVKDGKKIEFNDVHVLALQNHKLLKEAGSGGNDGGGTSGNPTFVPPANAGTGAKELPSYIVGAMNRH